MKESEFKLYNMLSHEEKEKLYDLAINIKLDNNDCILEYGVFFGGSLEALNLGISRNKNFKNNKLIGIDSFYASKEGAFYDIVLERAKLNNIEEKLEIAEEYVDWFDSVISAFGQYSNIELIRSLPKKFTLNNKNKIAILHLDLPKFYKELSEIFENIICNIRKGTIIVFQDYFYHWSAEIIAFGFYLIKNKRVKCKYIEHSTLAVENNNIIKEDIAFFSKKISDREYILNLLIESIAFYRDQINNHQLAILYLSITQFCYVSNFKIDFKYYNNLIKDIYDKNENTRKYINWMYEDIKKYNFDLYNLYNSSFIGFK